MNKFFQWFNERTQTEKIGLIGLVFLGIAFFLYQIYQQREEISNLEKELRQVQNLQAYYYEKRRLEKGLQQIKKGITFKSLSYEDIFNTAYKNNVTILEAEKIQSKKFFANISGNKIILSKGAGGRELNRRPARQKKQVGQRARKSIIVEPVNLKVMSYNKNMVSFLNELMENKLVSLAGLYSGCVEFANFERFKFPPKICDVDINQYKNWVCSAQRQNSFYITLLLLKVGE